MDDIRSVLKKAKTKIPKDDQKKEPPKKDKYKSVVDRAIKEYRK